MNCNQRAYTMFYLNVCHFVICPVRPSDVTNQRNSPTPLVRRHSWLRTSLRRTSPNTDTLVPPKRWGSFRWVQTFHMNYVSPVGPKKCSKSYFNSLGKYDFMIDCLVYVSMKLGKIENEITTEYSAKLAFEINMFCDLTNIALDWRSSFPQIEKKLIDTNVHE